MPGLSLGMKGAMRPSPSWLWFANQDTGNQLRKTVSSPFYSYLKVINISHFVLSFILKQNISHKKM